MDLTSFLSWLKSYCCPDLLNGFFLLGGKDNSNPAIIPDPKNAAMKLTIRLPAFGIFTHPSNSGVGKKITPGVKPEEDIIKITDADGNDYIDFVGS